MRQERILLIAIALAIGVGIGLFAFRQPLSSALQHATVARRHTPRAMSDAVVAFYRAIDEGRLKDAYALLSASYRKNTSYEAFASGYATTQQVTAEVSTSHDGRVPTTIYAVDETDAGERRRTFEGYWRVVWDGSRYHLNDGEFRTTRDTLIAKADLPGSGTAGNQNQGDGQTTTHDESDGRDRCPEQQNVEDFMFNKSGNTPNTALSTPPPDTALGYFVNAVSNLTPDGERRVYLVMKAHNASNNVDVDSVFKAIAAHCRLADMESIATPDRSGVRHWNTADFAPELLGDDDAQLKAFVAVTAAQTDAEIALAARGIVDDSIVENLYAPFADVIPLASVPQTIREGSYNELTGD